jgi:hypothetical protein
MLFFIKKMGFPKKGKKGLFLQQKKEKKSFDFLKKNKNIAVSSFY